jgi:N-acetyl-gamma-glutamyl-phosphate reductase
MSNQIRVALIGGSGYTGFEIIRCLIRHPRAQLVASFGQKESGPLGAIYPLLDKQTDVVQEIIDDEKLASIDADVVLLAAPHRVAMSYVPALRDQGLRVVDLSADYRLHDAAVYEQWYCPHTDAARLAEAVYGLPEFYEAQIAKADLVANPGCYPTCTTLGLAPLLAAGLIEPDGIVVNAISGVSGAGRKATLANHFPERNENFEPYGVGTHRHMPEMEQVLGELAGRPVELLFQPHLCPMDRGMLCSMYARPAAGATTESLTAALARAYADKPFVRVRTDVLPATKHVAGTNFCDVQVQLTKGRVVVFSALDNLLKGASGLAIQNMNVMFGLDQRLGLL